MASALFKSFSAVVSRCLFLHVGLVPILASLLLPMPCSADGHPANIARRGGIIEAPENTLPTYQISIDIGVDYVELDIWISADDVLVCFHDRTVNRTTDGTGLVFEKTLAELKALDAGSWFDPLFAGEQIPTFLEAIQLINGHAKIVLDVKYYEGQVEDRAKYFPMIAQILSDEGFPQEEVLCWPKGTAQSDECRTHLPNSGVIYNAWDANEFDEQRIWQRAVEGDRALMALYPTTTLEYADLVHSYGLALHVLDLGPGHFADAIAMTVDGMLLANPRALAEYPPPPPPACSDGVDNDGDGDTDFPDDISCFGPEDDHEAAECSDGLDNDGDGATDYPDDPGCFNASYPFEAPACEDGIDNNNDGLIDFGEDPGCFALVDQREGLHCNDQLDNDLDGTVDYPEDTGCSGPFDTSEIGEPAGALPDGKTIPGDQLIIDEVILDELVAVWSESCAAADTDYALYEGVLGDFDSHTPVTCSTGGSQVWQFAAGGGNRYYLAVPRTTTSEGSYGVDSDGAERPASNDACRDQILGPCD